MPLSKWHSNYIMPIRNIQAKNIEIEAANEELNIANDNLQSINEAMIAANEELISSEKEIIKLNHLYSLISQISQMIVRSGDQDTLYSEACRIAVKYGNFRMAWIAMADNSGTLKPFCCDGNEEGFLQEIMKFSIKDLLQQKEPSASALQERKYFLYNDIDNEHEKYAWKNEALKRGYLSSISLPIIVNGKINSAYSIYSSEAQFFSEEEIILLEEVTNDISFALESFEREKRRRQAEEALSRSEKRFHSLFETAKDSILITDRDTGDILDANPAACRLYGYHRDDFLYMKITNISAEPEKTSASVSDKITYVPLRYHRMKDGTVFPVEISIGFFEQDNQTLNTAIIRDITEKKQLENELLKSLKEKDILFKELQHRVKNNLNVIYSLLSFEQRKLTDEYSKQVLINAKSRIRAMSGIYEKLYQSASIDMLDLSLYMKDFIKSLYEIYVIDTEKVNFTSRIDEIKLDLKRTVPLILLLNELISNALKYAFRDRAKGEILIDLKKSGDKIVLTISDNGIGLPEGLNPYSAESMGFMLIMMLVEQIEGELINEIPEGGGASFTLSFKL